MLENKFLDHETAITPADLDHLESVIGRKSQTTWTAISFA